MIIYIILVSVGYAQFGYVQEVMNQLVDQECSLKNRIAYGQQKLHQLTGMYFCDSYAKRTCCSQQNLEELKFKWYREQQLAVELSQQCQEIFTKTICSDCDGDIGQQIRVGFCPHYCTQMYQACWRDLFQYDEKTQKLRLCYQNDVLCSELRNIVNNGDQFCTSLGYKVNSYSDREEWMENKYLNLSTMPLCWDGTPSHRIWSSGTKLPETKVGGRTKKQNNNEEQKSYLRFYVFAGLALVVVGFFIAKKKVLFWK
ncbi:unnamed protein product (macronuclear) [Paramecium tetraurelia]|uniref:Folate receptor-like domain-containing protein n=1 Tax=Paramecium tetraurelia TaxID=5888 RepID=A0BRL9_PARTE|nr:uncharacterized protein GSPATT00031417001 [Paramecium tetraurelia]CAK61186.1 unnamed protein product [Paramecium tetraurelia]|eukprot:XP_001428584.1 hypothetical protein (macronuclear) [Paramecium tetraurelia strain d4-2]